jgi:glycosyltransferase involved in cell wall biosynthesis
MCSARTTPKRVLMLLENNPYPSDIRVRQEAQALIAAGYEVSVVSPGRVGQAWYEDVDGVRTYRYPGPREGSSVLAFLWEYGYSLMATFLLSLLVWARQGIDVVHAHNPPDLFCLVGLWYKLWGKLFVFDHHDLAPEIWEVRSGKCSGLLYRALRLFEWLSCRVADRVIVTNESYRRINRTRNGVADWRITTVRNGPDLRRVRQVPPDPEVVATGRPVLAYVGVIGPQDGVEYLLQAVKYLRDEHGRDDVLCLIIGDGESVPALWQLSSDLGIGQQIRFTGRLHGDMLMAHMCAANICVDPDPANALNSLSTMIKITEYMALGKPIVAFDLPEHRASAGEAACYVPANDARAFAAAMVELLNDPGRRERMGQIGLQRIHESLSWHHSARNLVEAYDKFFADRTQPVASSS